MNILNDIYIKNADNFIIIDNSKIEVKIENVNGKLFTRHVLNKGSNFYWTNNEDSLTTLYLPFVDFEKYSVKFYSETKQNEDFTKYLTANWVFTCEDNTIVYTLSIFNDIPVINASVKISGHIESHLVPLPKNALNGVLNGKNVILSEWIPENASIFSVGAYSNHLNLTEVELFDATDDHNLCKTEKTFELFSPWAKEYQGNIFIVNDYLYNQAVLMVKESPVKHAQLGNKEYDFYFNKNRSVSICGIGLDFTSPIDVDFDTPLYSATFVFGDENSVRKDYHKYYLSGVSAVQKVPQILSNTWGDGNADKCINEEFMLSELETAKFLGVDIVQLDDGWQKGHTAGSHVKKGGAAIGEGMYDQQSDFWSVRETFPNGLKEIVKSAKKSKIEVGLWYSCDATDNYKYYEKDIKNILTICKKNNVSTIKVDGARLKNKECEKNFTKILSSVREKTNKKIKINMDITAGKRFGYTYMREFGNLFLENRFTKGRTYYPYRTLRNLWDLSKYLPTQRFQIECVNVKKNQENYAGDLLAPCNYQMDYVFAITMMANPLMWMEMQNLEDSDKLLLKNVIKVYKKIRSDLSSAFIEPIGNRPNGITFTGFNASLDDGSGYLLLFKENNNQNEFIYNVNLQGKKFKTLYKSLADIKVYNTTSGVKLTSNTKNSFILVKYY